MVSTFLEIGIYLRYLHLFDYLFELFEPLNLHLIYISFMSLENDPQRPQYITPTI